MRGVGLEDAAVHLAAGLRRPNAARRRVGQEVQRLLPDRRVAVLVGQDRRPIEAGRLGVDRLGEPDEHLKALARLRLPRELEHRELLEGRPRARRQEPVEERLPLGEWLPRVGVLAQLAEPAAQELIVALLVVELAGEHSAELALLDRRNPGRDQLRRAELVVDALPHPGSELALQGLAGGGGIEADIAPDPARAGVRGGRRSLRGSSAACSTRSSSTGTTAASTPGRSRRSGRVGSRSTAASSPASSPASGSPAGRDCRSGGRSTSSRRASRSARPSAAGATSSTKRPSGPLPTCPGGSTFPRRTAPSSTRGTSTSTRPSSTSRSGTRSCSWRCSAPAGGSPIGRARSSTSTSASTPSAAS